MSISVIISSALSKPVNLESDPSTFTQSPLVPTVRSKYCHWYVITLLGCWAATLNETVSPIHPTVELGSSIISTA